MITDIIFDFFGTLVNYQPGHFHERRYEQTYHMLCEINSQLTYDQFVDAFSSAFQDLERDSKATLREFHMYDVANRFFQQTAVSFPEQSLIARFIEHYIAEWNAHITPVNDIKPFIEALHQRYRLSIITNTHYPDLIHRNLQTIGIGDLFSVIVTSVEFGRRKPDPSIFQYMLKQLSIHSEHATYVGDSFDDDYIGATAAGLSCILIDPNDAYQALAPRRVARIHDLDSMI